MACMGRILTVKRLSSFHPGLMGDPSEREKSPARAKSTGNAGGKRSRVFLQDCPKKPAYGIFGNAQKSLMLFVGSGALQHPPLPRGHLPVETGAQMVSKKT